MGLTEKLLPEFRQRCEAIATERRSLLQLQAFDPLPAETLATDLGATLFTPDRVPNAAIDGRQQLLTPIRSIFCTTHVTHLCDVRQT